MSKTNASKFSLDLHKITVLLIDSQTIIAEEIKRALSGEEDIEFRHCSDPSKAIKLAAEINATVIFQNLVMPKVDGLMMVRYFRTNKASAKIPIIVLSTSQKASFKSEAFKLGANDYLVKLPEKIELVARIRYHSQAYISQLQRDEAFRALEKSQAQLAEANRTLQKLSSIDSLTGLANRRIFDETLKKEWNRAIRGDKPISLLMLDIDCFKLYNDHYGHQGGDSCLRKVAKGLQSALHRETDLLARYGGEEFSVVLPDTDLRGAVKVAEEMHGAIKALQLEHAKSKVSDIVTVCIGVSTIIPQKDTEPEVLLAAADQELYKAKADGRDCVKSGSIGTGSN
jgi:two-component system chemotaxis family response regulator WspR